MKSYSLERKNKLSYKLNKRNYSFRSCTKYYNFIKYRSISLQQYFALLIFVMVINCFGLTQVTHYIYKNNSHKEKIRPSMSVPVIENGKNIKFTHHNKSIFYNISKTPPFQDSKNKNQTYFSSSKHILLDFKDVDVVYNKCHEQVFDFQNNSQ